MRSCRATSSGCPRTSRRSSRRRSSTRTTSALQSRLRVIRGGGRCHGDASGIVAALKHPGHCKPHRQFDTRGRQVPPQYYPFLKKLGDDTPELKPFMDKLINGEMTYDDYEHMSRKSALRGTVVRHKVSRDPLVLSLTSVQVRRKASILMRPFSHRPRAPEGSTTSLSR